MAERFHGPTPASHLINAFTALPASATTCLPDVRIIVRTTLLARHQNQAMNQASPPQGS